MKKKAVKSSNLRGVAYDAETRVLEIEFRSGALWRYAEVQAPVVERLKKSTTPGTVFAREIRGKYKAERILRKIAPPDSSLP